MAILTCVVAGFLGFALTVIVWMSYCEDQREKSEHDTRAYETRIISTLRTPRLDLPIAAEYPSIDEVRNITFQMCDVSAQVQRIDVRMLTAADSRALKKLKFRFTKSYIDPINKGVTP